jgi:segregation and condensation protein B
MTEENVESSTAYRGDYADEFGQPIVRRRVKGFPWSRKPAPAPVAEEEDGGDEEPRRSWPAADRSGSWRIVPDPSAHHTVINEPTVVLPTLTPASIGAAAPAEVAAPAEAVAGPSAASVESEVAAVNEQAAAERAAQRERESQTSFENQASAWVPPWSRDGAETAPDPAPEFSPQEQQVGRFAYGDEDLPNPDEFVPDLGEERLRGALEAIMLVVDNPVTTVVLAQVLEEPTARIEATLEAMAQEYSRGGRGIDLRRVAGGWRFYTRPEYASYVERFVLDGQQIRLTQAALETLAVIAYKQPVTRSQVSAVRGVNCDGVIKTLVTRGLVEECGTEKDGAHLYRTTQLFLEKLGINSVDDLPSLAQFLPENLDEIDVAQR